MATTTLGLTQFTGTDTMNPLTQYNADMTKIDDSAKMSKAIGSDYIYSYTTPPSYSGGTITFYSGTKYACADGRDANGDIKQTIITLSTNKTIAFSGTDDYNVYIDNGQILSSVLTRRVGIVDFVSNLPTTVGTTAPYVYYVINEHRYYYTSGSTTASWSAKIYCKVASVRVASSLIIAQSFKPNLQLNLAQKIGKDKLLFSMSEVNANTDAEFVASAVAVKELGVDFIDFKGTTSGWNWVKWHSGKVELGGIFTSAFGTGTAFGTGGIYSHKTSAPIAFPFTVNNARVNITQNGALLNSVLGTDITTSQLDFYILNLTSGTLTSAQVGVWCINVVGTTPMG